MTENEKLLKLEREKLDQLIDEALQSGTAINETQQIRDQFAKVKRLEQVLQNEAVQTQSRKVDTLIEEIERERGEE